MEQVQAHSFGKVRSYVWPIYRHELKKIIPMFFMLFLICFNYTILRNLKDALVITAKSSGAEVIPFIKVWVILPAAILSTVAFTYLLNHFSRRKVYYIVLGTFIAYFAIFTFCIYPIHDQITLNSTADSLSALLPKGFKGLIAMVRNWPLTMFYVVSELWSTIVMSVLFWGFANEITRLSEATRFYSALNISSNVASIIAGQVAVAISTDIFNPNLFFGTTAWEQTLDKLMLLIIVSGVGILTTFHWMTKNVLNDPLYIPEEARKTKKDKKLNFRQSLSYLAHSKYLICIATIVVSYNLVIHMVEVIWKDKLRELCPNPQDYNNYMNNLTSLMGIISTIAALLMVGIIRKLGWMKTALVTPIVLFVTTVAFFTCLLASDHISPMAGAFFGVTPLFLAVFVGSVQNCFTKAAKYSLFDVTKEMVFIPLAPEHKLKGKTTIDGIGSRLGKSGGSLIHQGLLVLFCTLSASTPFVAAILLIVLVMWIGAVRILGKEFSLLTKNMDTGMEEESDPEPAPTFDTRAAQPA